MLGTGKTVSGTRNMNRVSYGKDLQLSKHNMLTQCWLNVSPPSMTLDQLFTGIGQRFVFAEVSHQYLNHVVFRVFIPDCVDAAYNQVKSAHVYPARIKYGTLPLTNERLGHVTRSPNYRRHSVVI